MTTPHLDLNLHYRKQNSGTILHAIELTTKRGTDAEFIESPYLALPAEFVNSFACRVSHRLPRDAWFSKQFDYEPAPRRLDDRWWQVFSLRIRVSYVQSCFIYCERIPSCLVLGTIGGARYGVLLSEECSGASSAVPPEPPRV